MENIQVTTAQNVGIQYEIASLGDRITAELIDIFVKLGYLGMIWALVRYEVIDYDLFPISVQIALYLPVLLYDFVFEVLNNGQSLGKMAMHIRVLMLDGSRPGIVAYAIRWVFRLVELDVSFGSIALWVYLFSQRGQRLGDIAAGTSVVKLREQAFSSTIFEFVDPAYSPVYTQASLLLDSEAGIIREVLDAFHSEHMSRQHFDAIALETQKRLSARLGIREVATGPVVFLDNILKDYNYYHQRQS